MRGCGKRGQSPFLAHTPKPLSSATAYIHNGFGDVIQVASPDTGTTIYAYDSGANLTRRTDARGIVTDFTYDALDRVLTQTFPATPAENVVYTYDSLAAGAHGIGRLAAIPSTIAVGVWVLLSVPPDVALARIYGMVAVVATYILVRRIVSRIAQDFVK